MPTKTVAELKEEIIAGVTAETKRLDMGKFKIPVELDIVTAQALIGTLQLAMRHPEYHTLLGVGPLIERIVSGIMSRIPPDCPNIRKLIEMGFDKSFDE